MCVWRNGYKKKKERERLRLHERRRGKKEKIGSKITTGQHFVGSHVLQYHLLHSLQIQFV